MHVEGTGGDCVEDIRGSGEPPEPSIDSCGNSCKILVNSCNFGGRMMFLFTKNLQGFSQEFYNGCGLGAV